MEYFFFYKGNTFPSLEKLVDALKQGEVDGILVDLYTAHYRSDLFNASWIEISQILPFEFTSGVVISGNAAKLERHFREYVASKATVVTTILQKTNQQNDKVTQVHACYTLGKSNSGQTCFTSVFTVTPLVCSQLKRGRICPRRGWAQSSHPDEASIVSLSNILQV